MASCMISVEHVSKRYGPVKAVSGASFEVREGDVCGLVGSDGAGKTTLLRMVAAMIRPDEGSLRLAGLDPVRDREPIKRLIGYMPQRFALYQDLTVAENVTFFMDVYGIFGRERAHRRDKYLGFSNLLPFLDRRAGDLSGGMKQKLGLACVLVHEPRILVLDEPTNGVDPVSREEFWELLAEMKRSGMTILVSTAYLDEGEKCDQLVLMHRSRVVAAASPSEIRAAHQDLEEAMISMIQEADQSQGEGSGAG